MIDDPIKSAFLDSVDKGGQLERGQNIEKSRLGLVTVKGLTRLGQSHHDQDQVLDGRHLVGKKLWKSNNPLPTLLPKSWMWTLRVRVVNTHREEEEKEIKAKTEMLSHSLLNRFFFGICATLFERTDGTVSICASAMVLRSTVKPPVDKET